MFAPILGTDFCLPTYLLLALDASSFGETPFWVRVLRACGTRNIAVLEADIVMPMYYLFAFDARPLGESPFWGKSATCLRQT